MTAVNIPQVVALSERFELFDDYSLLWTGVHDYGLQSRFDICCDERKIGELGLHYTPPKDTVHVGIIKIREEEHRRRGVGRAIYQTIPGLPIPIMRWHTQDKAAFVSSDKLSEMSYGLWMSLVRDELAQVVDGKFELRRQDGSASMIEGRFIYTGGNAR